MKEILSKILIIIGIAIYTITLFIFLEMPVNYKIVLLVGEYLMYIGVSISSINGKEK